MDTILWEKESDNYTRRAMLSLKEHLFNNEVDGRDAQWLGLKKIKSVLDIGCGYGSFAGELKKRFPKSKVVGLDPGTETIKLAKKHYKHITFLRGYSDRIKLHEKFDLVVVRMVLQWIPRSLLLKTIAEIDRLTGKYLYIKEYNPRKPTSSVSKHNKKVRIFKQNYSQIFLSMPNYILVKEKVECNDSEYHRNRYSLIEKKPIEESYKIL